MIPDVEGRAVALVDQELVGIDVAQCVTQGPGLLPRQLVAVDRVVQRLAQLVVEIGLDGHDVERPVWEAGGDGVQCREQ